MEPVTFSVLHEERLLRSLLAETPLPREAARAAVRDVLARAAERTHPSDGAAYAWCLVAARHRALAAPGDTAWAAAADAVMTRERLGAASRALSALPPQQRELLRLRYVEGLRPDAIAARLGTSTPAARKRIERAHGAAARELRRGPFASVLAAWRVRVAANARPFAAIVCGGVAAVTAFSVPGPAATPPSPAAPRSVAAPPAGAGWTAPEPANAAVPATRTPSRARAAGAAARTAERVTARAVAPVPREPAPPARTCAVAPAASACAGEFPKSGDAIEIPLPENPTNTESLVVDQSYVDCAEVPTPPAGIARCRSGH